MSSDRGRGEPGVRHDAVPAKVPAKTPGSAEIADPYAHWLDRMQRARGRQAAITKNLYTWSNYKNWADRMKDSFEDEPAAPDAGAQVNPNAPRLPKK